MGSTAFFIKDRRKGVWSPEKKPGNVPLHSQVSLRLLKAPCQFLYRKLKHVPLPTASPSTAPASNRGPYLPWEQYLRYRRSQRTYGLIASIPTTIAGFLLGGSYFASLEADPSQPIFGTIDPMWA